MNGATGPLPRPQSLPVDPNAVGLKILGALTGRILGEMADDEKAAILESVEQSNHDLLESIQALDESVNALGNLLNLWTTTLVEWSRSGGKSIQSLQSVIRDVTERAEAAEGEEEGEEEENDEAGDEAGDEADSQVIDAQFRRVSPDKKKP